MRPERMIALMMLAGIRVAPEFVRELADLVDEPTATALEQALEVETTVLALSIADRERILRALEDCPDGLGELRPFCSASMSGACAKGSSRSCSDRN
jgi:hypothetical protein